MQMKFDSMAISENPDSTKIMFVGLSVTLDTSSLVQSSKTKNSSDPRTNQIHNVSSPIQEKKDKTERRLFGNYSTEEFISPGFLPKKLQHIKNLIEANPTASICINSMLEFELKEALRVLAHHQHSTSTPMLTNEIMLAISKYPYNASLFASALVRLDMYELAITPYLYLIANNIPHANDLVESFYLLKQAKLETSINAQVIAENSVYSSGLNRIFRNLSENDYALLTLDNLDHLLKLSSLAEEIADELDQYGNDSFSEQENSSLTQLDLDGIIQNQYETLKTFSNDSSSLTM